jgi:arylesterase/paraoxonase
MANGVTKGHDGLYYVAQSSSGKITVFSLQPETNTFLKVNEISIGMPVDNLSIDENGDIWVAAFPVGVVLLMATDNPLEVDVPSAVFRIRKVKGEEAYEVKMVLEDIEGKTLPGSTGVVHDAKTGKLFLGGVTSNFVTVCEPKV